MNHSLLLDVCARLLHWGGQRRAHRLLARRHGPQRQPHTEQVAQSQLGYSLADPVGAREKSDHRLQSRAESPRWNTIGQIGQCGVAASIAALRVHLMLGHVRLRGRDLDDLVARRLPNLGSRLRRQAGPALLARHRPVVLDLVHLLGRQQLPAAALVPRLTAGVSSARRPLRWELQPRRIGRWRLRGILRVLVQPRFQSGDQPLQSRNLSFQSGDLSLQTRHFLAKHRVFGERFFQSSLPEMAWYSAR